MLDVMDVRKFYDDFAALDAVSFSVMRGTCLGLIGPNGAGKSTLCRVLAGVFLPDEGDVRLDGVSVFSSMEYRLSVGYLPEEPALPRDWVVRDFVEWAGFLRMRGRGSSSVADVLGMVGLSDVASRVIGTLSRGYRQRVGLAAAIIGGPKLLVLDEPATGLDPVQQGEFRALVASLCKDRVVVMSSHILGEVERVCSSVLLIDGGRVVADVAAGELDAYRGTRRFKLVLENVDRTDGLPDGFMLADERRVDRAGVTCRELVLEGKGELGELVDWASSCGLRVLSVEEESAGLEALFMRLRENKKNA
ncbi:ABC transporter ATP-binding protein [Spirochaetia bacterium 38H-sp]|uniref:ABC transporter ATP-binding protein n=1 Tax=Rarispira pelagica TaxID=3141764 RepID=A0ABU9UBP3_9SPIR